MDVTTKNRRQANNKRNAKKGIKVVYISSPMKVKTSASKFRAIVQQLTGRDSDVARFMENSNGAAVERVWDQGAEPNRDFVSDVLVDDPYQSPASSDSLFEPSFDNLFAPHQVEESFMRMFSSNSILYDQSSQLDVFRSYDAA